MEQIARQYLSADPALHIDMLANLGKADAPLLYAAEDGVVQIIGGWLAAISFRHAADTDRFLAMIPADIENVSAHQAFFRDRLLKAGAYQLDFTFLQVFYGKKEPLPVPLPEGVELRALTQADWPVVQANYRTVDEDGAYVRERIEAGMLGAFVSGQLAGFMGTHDERSMGLLVVLPQFRRHHLAETLERALINQRLACGELPYGQVRPDNEASLALQRKLGMTISNTPIWWMRRYA